jgi:hypothetical protein
VRGRVNLMRQHALGALVFLLTLGLTSGAISTLEALDPHPPRALEAAVLVVASACATISRFVGLRSWVFAAPDEGEPATRLPACPRSA